MKAIENFENVQATSGEFERPTPGGYIIQIQYVEDVPLDESTGKGNYLKLFYDIAAGTFKEFYTEQNKKFGSTYIPMFIRSYKANCAGMFKHFINCVEASNPMLKWEWNENDLAGRFLGAVIGEEEYESKDGSIKTRLYVKDIKTIDQIKSGDFKVPELKTIKREEKKTSTGFVEVATDDDLPF